MSNLSELKQKLEDGLAAMRLEKDVLIGLSECDDLLPGTVRQKIFDTVGYEFGITWGDGAKALLFEMKKKTGEAALSTHGGQSDKDQDHKRQ